MGLLRMNLEEFLLSADRDASPPTALSQPLQALWYAQKGLWEMSHEITQELHTKEGSWIHAHLHREEGDMGNARYWYAKSGHPESSDDLANERLAIIEYLLNAS